MEQQVRQVVAALAPSRAPAIPTAANHSPLRVPPPPGTARATREAPCAGAPRCVCPARGQGPADPPAQGCSCRRPLARQRCRSKPAGPSPVLHHRLLPRGGGLRLRAPPTRIRPPRSTSSMSSTRRAPGPRASSSRSKSAGPSWSRASASSRCSRWRASAATCWCPRADAWFSPTTRRRSCRRQATGSCPGRATSPGGSSTPTHPHRSRRLGRRHDVLMGVPCSHHNCRRLWSRCCKLLNTAAKERMKDAMRLHCRLRIVNAIQLNQTLQPGAKGTQPLAQLLLQDGAVISNTQVCSGGVLLLLSRARLAPTSAARRPRAGPTSTAHTAARAAQLYIASPPRDLKPPPPPPAPRNPSRWPTASWRSCSTTSASTSSRSSSRC
jgi:hypothetical protein